MCCTCKVVVVVSCFLLIRSTVAVFYRSRCFHPVSSITRFYIFFEETINIKESFVFSPGQIYILSWLHNLPRKQRAFKLFAYLISILLRFSLILNPWDAYKTLRTRAYVSSWILQFLVKIELKLKLRNLA